MSEHKALAGVEVKDALKGTVEAVFATFNVIDADGDVTLPGAFQEGAKVRISAFGHASWGPSRGAASVPVPPVGKGEIRTTGSEAILHGQFFLNTTGGRDHFELVKEMGDLQEWSYGFDIGESEPGEWEGQKVRLLKRQIVHEVSPVLIGAGVDTRTLAVKGQNLPFAEEADHALGSVEAFIQRARDLGSLRASEKGEKEGRVLSAANRERLMALGASLGEASTAIEELLAETDPNKARDLLVREFARFERLRASI